MAITKEYIDGIRTFIIPENMTGKFAVNESISSPGDRVKWGKKLYEIQNDYSLKRLDKKRKR